MKNQNVERIQQYSYSVWLENSYSNAIYLIYVLINASINLLNVKP